MNSKPEFVVSVKEAEKMAIKKRIKFENKEFERFTTNHAGAGYIYLIHCETTNYYKIGVSKINLSTRLSNLQSGCPFTLTPIHCEHIKNTYKTEKMLHSRYANKRISGEWFEFGEKEVRAVVSEIQNAATDQYELKLR